MSNRVIRSFLKSLGLNIMAGLVGMLPFLFGDSEAILVWGIALLFIAVISLLAQLIIAIRCIRTPEKKEEGQGMLLAVGVLALSGLAVCGPMWINII